MTVHRGLAIPLPNLVAFISLPHLTESLKAQRRSRLWRSARHQPRARTALYLIPQARMLLRDVLWSHD